MDIIARKGTIGVSVSLLLMDDVGRPISPDPFTAVTARFYRVDPATGLLALDVGLPGGGVLALTEQFTIPCWYGANYNVSTAQFENYTIVVTWVSGGLDRRRMLRMFLSDDLLTVFQNSITTPSSRSTLLAPP